MPSASRSRPRGAARRARSSLSQGTKAPRANEIAIAGVDQTPDPVDGAMEHPRVILAARAPLERVVLLQRVGRHTRLPQPPLLHPLITGGDLVALVATGA